MKHWLGRLLTSSLGRKYVMAATGLLLVLFLCAHLAGNLTLFAGDELFNAYAHALESNPLLPLAEAGLGALFAVHVAFAVVLIAKNRSARRDKYGAALGVGAKTLASTTMAITGPLLLLFLLVHLWDFRIQKMFAAEGYDLAVAVRERLASPVGATIYIVSMIVLCAHLWHAVQSAAQTLGLAHPRWRAVVAWLGRVLAVVLSAGFLSLPFWFFAFRR